MKILKHIFTLFLFLQYNCYAFNSVEEVLAFETIQIANVGSADSYINRAESFLLCQKYFLALDDLEMGYQLAKDHPTMLLRSLFGLAIVYANINKLQEFYVVVNCIEQLLDAHKCIECATKDSKELCSHNLRKSLLSKTKPERISVEECIEKANNTARYARILINRSHPAAKLILNALVKRLTNKAIKCCAAGGLWRDCIHPLATKWLEWSEKWKLFK